MRENGAWLLPGRWDPFGIKLIYWRVDSGRLFFGSEMRAVRASDAAHKSRDRSRLPLNLFRHFVIVLRHRLTRYLRACISSPLGPNLPFKLVPMR